MKAFDVRAVEQVENALQLSTARTLGRYANTSDTDTRLLRLLNPDSISMLRRLRRGTSCALLDFCDLGDVRRG